MSDFCRKTIRVSWLVGLVMCLWSAPALAQDDIYVQPRNTTPAPATRSAAAAPKSAPEGLQQRNLQVNMLMYGGLTTTYLSIPDLNANDIVFVPGVTGNGGVMFEIEVANSMFGIMAGLGTTQKNSSMERQLLGGAGQADTTIRYDFQMSYISIPVLGRLRLVTQYKDRLNLALIGGLEFNLLRQALFRYSEKSINPNVYYLADFTSKASAVETNLVLGVSFHYWLNDYVGWHIDARSGAALNPFDSQQLRSTRGGLALNHSYLQLNTGIVVRLY